MRNFYGLDLGRHPFMSKTLHDIPCAVRLLLLIGLAVKLRGSYGDTHIPCIAGLMLTTHIYIGLAHGLINIILVPTYKRKIYNICRNINMGSVFSSAPPGKNGKPANGTVAPPATPVVGGKKKSGKNKTRKSKRRY